MKVLCTVSGWIAVLCLSRAVPCQVVPPTKSAPIKTTFGDIPLYFVENRGVYPAPVKYYIQGTDKTLFFTKDGITFRLEGKKRAWAVKLDFVGANPETRPEGRDRQEAVFSYFNGPEKDWKTGLPAFSRIVYRDLWPGIDLVYNGTVNKLKYEFVVAPGGDPATIRLRYRGATSVAATAEGALRVETSEGSFEDGLPIAWQVIGGKRVQVEIAFALEKGGAFTFALGAYDRSRPLILDPVVVVYCGYIGGSGSDWPGGLAVDSSGNAYVSGHTTSAGTFPVRVGPSLTMNGSADGFVAKVSPEGKLVYCGYIGGSGDEILRSGIAVDGAGNAYVVGLTTSAYHYFPAKIGPDLTYNGGYSDAFVAKVNPTGTGLVYCGFIGGDKPDEGLDIAIDQAGNAYVIGDTGSTEQTFPVRNGPDLTYNGQVKDVFVAKVNAGGTGLDYCGYIGGPGYDAGGGITVDRNGNAYVTGCTDSDERSFPVRVGPDLIYCGGTGNQNNDAFVAKIAPSGSALVYCGYIGGFGYDAGSDVVVDSAGNLYVTGGTACTSLTFPVKVGPDLTYNGGTTAVPSDAFVARVNAAGSALDFCGYIGGSGNDGGMAIALSPSGHVHVAGCTASHESSFPVQDGPDLTFNGGCDAFVAKLDSSGRGLIHCGYIGGDSYDDGQGIALDASGNIYVHGYAYSTEATFPVKGGPDLTHNGGPNHYNQSDTFVAKLRVTRLQAMGTPQPGGTVRLDLTASTSAGRSYQLGSSLGPGPIMIDSRRLDLSPDALLEVSTKNYWPMIFSGYSGVIDRSGQASASVRIPNSLALVGVRIYSAFVTLSPAAPSGIKSISNTFIFSITS